MNELVSQGVNPVEHHAKYRRRVAVGQRQSCCFFPTGKTIFPLFFADFSALMIPEALEDIRVVQQHPDAAGELGPNEILDVVGCIERAQLFEKGFEGFPLG